MFSKIDLCSRYYQLRIKEEDILKSAFWIRYEYYEFVIKPYSLTKALTTFMDLINRVFKDYLDKFVIMFINDILVYSKNEKEYKQHLEAVL